MGTISRLKTWISGDTLTAADLNGEFNTILSTVNGYIESINLGTLTTTMSFVTSTNVDCIDIVRSATGAGSVIDAQDAGTGAMIDLQKTGIGTLLYLNQDAEAITIDIDSEQTTTDIINISAAPLTTGIAIDIPDLDALTTGTAINIASNSSSAGSRNLVAIKNDHASATGAVCISVDQDASAIAVNIDSASATADVLNFTAASLTTGIAIDIPDLDALTSGTGINLVSNSSDSTARNLIFVKNDHASATGAACVRIQNDYTSGAAFVISG